MRYFLLFLYLLVSTRTFAQIPAKIAKHRETTMIQALQEARANNPDLKVVKYNIDVAASDTITAALKPNPVINFQVLQLLDAHSLPDNTNLLSRNSRQFWLQLTKQFQIKNQRKNKIDLAQKNYEMSKMMYENTERNLYFVVANQWLDTWILQKRVKIIRESQANIDTLVKINENRLKNEVITKTEVIRTQILSQQFDAQLIELNRDYINNLRALKYLIGTNDSLTISEGQFMDMEIRETADTLLHRALTERTDVKVAQSQVKIGESNLRLQKSLAFPRPELGVIWNPQNAVPYGGIFATFPLPIYDKNQGEIQKAKISVDQANTAAQTLDLQIRNELSRAYFDYETQKLRLSEFKKIVEQSQIVLSTIKYAYLRGNTTIIDFLDAQRTYYSSQRDYNDALYNLKQSYIYLLFVSGQLEKLAK
jgi:cobalt-zinc-cadmium efflux system outer membrane protein